MEQCVEGLQEAVGQLASHQGDDTLEVSADHPGHHLHRLDLRAHDVVLFATESLAKVLAILPGPCRALGGQVGKQRREISPVNLTQVAGVFRQRPAQSLERRIALLLGPAG
jgi:hypothetical protein